MDNGTGSRNKKLSVGGKWLGLTTISDSTNLPLGALKEATNVVTEIGGMLRKREGFKLQETFPNNIVYHNKINIIPSNTLEDTSALNSNSQEKGAVITFDNIPLNVEIKNKEIISFYSNSVKTDLSIMPVPPKQYYETLFETYVVDYNDKEILVNVDPLFKPIKTNIYWTQNNREVHYKFFVKQAGIGYDYGYIGFAIDGSDSNTFDAHGAWNSLYQSLRHLPWACDWDEDQLLRHNPWYVKAEHIFHIDLKGNNELIGMCFDKFNLTFFVIRNKNSKQITQFAYIIDKMNYDKPITQQSDNVFFVSTFSTPNPIKISLTWNGNNVSKMDIDGNGIVVNQTIGPYEGNYCNLTTKFNEQFLGNFDMPSSWLKQLGVITSGQTIALNLNYQQDRWFNIYIQKWDGISQKNGKYDYTLKFLTESSSVWNTNEKNIFDALKRYTIKTLNGDLLQDVNYEVWGEKSGNKIPYYQNEMNINLKNSSGVLQEKFLSNIQSLDLTATNYISFNKLSISDKMTKITYSGTNFILYVQTYNNKDINSSIQWVSDYDVFNDSNENVELIVAITEYNRNANFKKLLTISTPQRIHSNLFDYTNKITLELQDFSDLSFSNNILVINENGFGIKILRFFKNNNDFFVLINSLSDSASRSTSQILYSVGYNMIAKNVDMKDSFSKKQNKIIDIGIVGNNFTKTTDKILEAFGTWMFNDRVDPNNITATKDDNLKLLNDHLMFDWNIFFQDGTTIEKKDAGKQITLNRSQIKDGIISFTVNVSVKKDLFDHGIQVFKTGDKINNLDGTDTTQFDIEFKNQKLKIEDKSLELQSCKYSDFLEGKLVLYGNKTNRIYTSMLNDPTYFYANNIVFADSFGKKEPITAIEQFKDIKIIFTENTMMSMSGEGNYVAESPWAILGLDSANGAPYHDGIVPIENTLAFQSKNGIYIISQISVADKRVELVPLSLNLNNLSVPYNDIIDSTVERLDSNVIMMQHEKRLLVYYETKKYWLIYDYSTTEFNSGVWFKWITKSIYPTFLQIQNGILIVLSGQKMYSKLPKLNQHIYDVEFKNNLDYYKDDKEDIEVIISTRDSTFGEVDQYKRIKNISIVTTNSKVGTSSLEVSTYVDSQPDLNYKTEELDWKIPTLNNFILGQQMTLYRPYDNLYSNSFMKSKNGRLVSVTLKEKSNLPFELKELTLDVMESKAKNKNMMPNNKKIR